MTASQRLTKIKIRTEAATDGPWGWGQGDLCHLGGFVAGPPIHYEAVWANRASDAKFIAASRTDVPALVAALEAVLELHKPDWSDWGSDHPWCAACRGYYPCPTVEAVNEVLGAPSEPPPTPH